MNSLPTAPPTFPFPQSEPTHEFTAMDINKINEPDPAPVPFQGDFFGQYLAEELPGWGKEPGPSSCDNASNSDSDLDEGEDVPPTTPEVSDDESNDNRDLTEWAAAAQPRWEPERPIEAAATSEPTNNEQVCADNLQDSTHQASHLLAPPNSESEASLNGDQENRQRMENTLRSEIYVQKFPLEVAGTPIVLDDDAPSEANTTHTGYAEYAAKLATSTDNIYAQFASKLEWEFARWSKLRGSGSTACNELLAINGVSALIHIHLNNISYCFGWA